jgi:anti-sigma factor RsiW
VKCQEAEDHLDAYVSGELSPDLRREIKTHLKGCKKCRARLAEVRKKGAPAASGEPAAVSETSSAVPPPESPFPDSPASSSPVGQKEFFGLMVILLIIGGAIYLYSQSSDSPPPPDEKPAEMAAPAPEESALPNEEAAPPASVPPTSVPPAGPSANVPPAPMKLHKETTHALSKEAQRQARLAAAAPTVKIVVVSRDQNEAADLVEARAVESEGRLLKKKRGEMETRLTLLLPANRYDSFFESRQALGPAREVSKKKKVSKGSLKVEVAIE